MKVLIVEDEELYADKMEMQLDKLGYEHLATVDNSDEALREIETTLPDLILMDVNINGEYDGIELADMIHQKEDIPIIFITSLEDDMTFRRAKRTNPVGFLTKPFNELQLQRSIELVVSQLEKKEEVKHKETKAPLEVFTTSHFFIKNRQKLEKVNFEDIVYLEADGRYTQIITKNKKYLIRKPLQELHSRLNTNQFVQSHRSFILNLKLVTSVDLFEMIINLDGFHVPLSKRLKEDFLKRLETI
jgi:DNA-binding LytR/AlgR family response regulator